MQKVLVGFLLCHAFLVNWLGGQAECKSLLPRLLPASVSAGGRLSRSRRSAAWSCPVYVTSATGYNLAVSTGGAAYGVRISAPPASLAYALLDRISVEMGLVMFRSKATGRYLSIDDNGKISTTAGAGDANIFIELPSSNGMTSYASRRLLEIRGPSYLGINRSGKPARTLARDTISGRLRQSQEFMVRPATPCQNGWTDGR